MAHHGTAAERGCGAPTRGRALYSAAAEASAAVAYGALRIDYSGGGIGGHPDGGSGRRPGGGSDAFPTASSACGG